jgi:hypothetical protein
MTSEVRTTILRFAANEEGDGYQAALVNFRFLAHALWTTGHIVGLMREAAVARARTPAAVNPPPAP